MFDKLIGVEERFIEVEKHLSDPKIVNDRQAYQTYVREYSGNKVVKVGCGPGGINRTWTDVVMKKAGRLMNAIGQHFYVRGSGTWE